MTIIGLKKNISTRRTPTGQMNVKLQLPQGLAPAFFIFFFKLCVCVCALRSPCGGESGVFVGGESVGSLWSCVRQQEEPTPTAEGTDSKIRTRLLGTDSPFESLGKDDRKKNNNTNKTLECFITGTTANGGSTPPRT